MGIKLVLVRRHQELDARMSAGQMKLSLDATPPRLRSADFVILRIATANT
jgi:hypothetical protein